MKLVITTILYFALLGIACGQHFVTSLYCGYGAYQLNDLKELQSDIAKISSLSDIEEVQQFPGYLNYTASVQYFIRQKNLIGITWTYYTTGGRNSLSDYSGEYELNMALKGNNLGIQYRNILASFGKLDAFLQINAGIMFSSLKISESLKIYPDYSLIEKANFQSFSYTAHPAAGVFYPLGKGFSLEANLGYQLYVKSKLVFSEKPDAQLMNYMGEYIMLNWSGFRVNIGVSYDIF